MPETTLKSSEALDRIFQPEILRLRKRYLWRERSGFLKMVPANGWSVTS
jgi:hypothetical protein